MSIVLPFAAASSRAAVPAASSADWWLLALLAVSFAAAALAGVVPPRNVSGPDRLRPDRSAWMLLGVMFGAAGLWVFSSSLYLTLVHPGSSATTAPAAAPHVQQELTAADNAYMSTVPPILGFLAMLLGDAVAREVTGQELGISPRLMSRGIVSGLVGIVIVVPPLFLAEEVIEAIYRRIHYKHAAEHPLLHVLGEKPSAGVVAAIVFGACVAAPLFEELLFRGHLQTLIRRLFSRLSGRGREQQPAFPVITSDPAATIPMPAMPVTQPAGPSAVQTWAAIILTSLIFAAIHPLWSAPVIFLLALCLGYAYERTGNLWVPITIHAGFNTISTLIFLSTLHPA